MGVDLANKLMLVPRRENAGSRSSNRFTYQQVWAFSHMLDMITDNKDFMLIMEFHDDVIILDSSDDPQYIDFYQIKTDTKASAYITTPFLIRNADKYPNKVSIMQKLIDNYSKFRTETNSIHLVSNKHFDFNELVNGGNSKARSVIHLNELKPQYFAKLKVGMCQACHCSNCPYSIGCNETCLFLLHFDVSSLDINNYEDTTLGKFVNFLDKSGIDATTKHAKSVYYTLLGEIRRVNNCELEPSSFDELIKLKSITKSSFIEALNKLKTTKSPKEHWETVKQYLLTDGISTIEINKIEREWTKYHLQSMDVESPYLFDIEADIKKLLSEIEFDNAKQCLEYVHERIKSQQYYSLYPKQYFSAIISKELYL